MHHSTDRIRKSSVTDRSHNASHYEQMLHHGAMSFSDSVEILKYHMRHSEVLHFKDD